MRRLKQILIIVFALVFIVIPAIVGMFFVLSFAAEVPYFYMWIIALGIILWGLALGIICYKTALLPIEALNLFIPLTFVFAGMFVARDLPWWALVIIALGLIFTAIPTNMVVARIKRIIILKAASSKVKANSKKV